VFTANREGIAERDAFAAALPVDAVIETVGGTADTLDEAIETVRAGGTVAVLGVFTAAPSLAALALVSKEVRLVGSLTYGRPGLRSDFEVALQLLERRREEAAELITHHFALDQIQRGFEAASNKAGGAIKVSIVP
jgi:alcohol dehydrogenase